MVRRSSRPSGTAKLNKSEHDPDKQNRPLQYLEQGNGFPKVEAQQLAFVANSNRRWLKRPIHAIGHSNG